jgi:hypothetical protein
MAKFKHGPKKQHFDNALQKARAGHGNLFKPNSAVVFFSKTRSSPPARCPPITGAQLTNKL